MDSQWVEELWNLEVEMEIIAEFPWPSKRTPNEVCRVSIQESRDGKKVHVEAWADGQRKDPGVVFRPNELPSIIQALGEALERLK